ncbi:MAG: MerR family transcriptional regulator [Chloroflexia bacterium]|nr:MerR family transcriptional regulator [Chloroflexia bacterium]MDQ3413216.1 MerR family transcriptional regulator [Chloroflexota bacterium]
MESLAIGEVARRAGVRTSAIRYYETVGILPPARREHGQRRYDPATVHRLAVVKLAQTVGFSIAEVRDLVAGFEREGLAAERWRESARQKLIEVRAYIERADQMRQVLEDSLRCDCLTLDACPLVIDHAHLPSGSSRTAISWACRGRSPAPVVNPLPPPNRIGRA